MNGKKARALRRIARGLGEHKKVTYKRYLSKDRLGRFMFSRTFLG